MSNPITIENALTGSSNWSFPSLASIQVQAYSDRTSYNVGDTATFYVSTSVASTAYTLDLYRLGYYAGNGARLITSVAGNVGQAQGYWDNAGSTLTNDSTVLYNSTTHLTDANWTSSLTLTIGSWCTGVYEAKFTDANGYQNGCFFVVKGNTSADYCYVRPTTTDQAYNVWGGYSLYSTPQGQKVSYNRPVYTGGGSAGIFSYELGGIHWLEKQGYNLSYISDIDIEANNTILSGYPAVLSPGHDEYWSFAKRAAFEAFIASGKGVAFLGANACFQQIRFENDANGNPYRTIVGYKVSTGSGTYPPSLDPMYGVDNTKVCTQWRDVIVNRPENAMCGIMYTSNTHTANFGWIVDPNAPAWLLAGTGLIPGVCYGGDQVGSEWDKIWNNGFTPPTLQTIGTTPVNGLNGNDVSHTVCYRAPSGAFVFASGSLSWTWVLDTFRDGTPANPKTIAGVQTLMTNIMTALLTNVVASKAYSGL